MAIFHYRDANVELNSVDLSNDIQSAELSYNAEQLDKTAMGDSDRSRLPGLRDFTLSITFFQDYAASQVDATLFSLVGATAFPFTLKPNGATASATNPQFSGNVTLQDYQVITGTIGDIATVAATFLGGGVLTRATST